MTVKNFYAATGSQHTFLKKGPHLSLLVVKELPPINSVPAAKKLDILLLLQSLGQDEVSTS